MNEYLLSAFIFGITAGFSPGPLNIIVVQETLQNGLRHGLIASLAPVITDGPIIAASLLLLTRFKNIDMFIAGLSFIGGLYLFYLAFKIIGIKSSASGEAGREGGSLSTAIKVNFLNPNPYLFWFTVGGTYIVTGMFLQSAVFIIASISTLVASKMTVAFISSKFRNLFQSNVYIFAMRCLGIAMALFGLAFLNKTYQMLFLNPAI